MRVPSLGILKGFEQIDAILDGALVHLGRERYSPIEDWHVVGTAGEPAFASGWSNVSGVAPLGFCRDTAGAVHLRGQPQHVKDVGQRIFTLPPGYRSDVKKQFSLVVVGVGGNDSYCSLVIYPDGRVEFIWDPASTNATSIRIAFDGTYFHLPR